jgi:hypothetical protein
VTDYRTVGMAEQLHHVRRYNRGELSDTELKDLIFGNTQKRTQQYVKEFIETPKGIEQFTPYQMVRVYVPEEAADATPY